MPTAKAPQAQAQEPPRKRTRGKTSPVPKAEEPAEARRKSAARGAGDAPTSEAGGGPAAPAAPAAPAGAGAGAQRAASSQGLAFLRLSSECSHATALKPLVYLNREEVTVGRLPTCDVLLDSTRVPQMISRVHGKLQRQREDGGAERWALVDNKSMNGILVNNEKVAPEAAHVLQPGDVITFGRKISPPEFEYIFEAPVPEPAAEQAPADDVMHDQMQRIAKLEEELRQEREQQRAQREQKRGSKSALDLSDLHSELACSVCQDWLVSAATLECSHIFCWSCIDTWLGQKHFECPVCRSPVKREPVKNRAMDNIVQKSIDRLSDAEKQEFSERVAAADAAAKKAQRLHLDLEKSVSDALKKGKNFFSIDSSWSRRERDTFARGVKDYSGNTRETYCKLTGLTVQWVHTADSLRLNRALHNLNLQRHVDMPDDEIRQRLLMYLRYG